MEAIPNDTFGVVAKYLEAEALALLAGANKKTRFLVESAKTAWNMRLQEDFRITSQTPLQSYNDYPIDLRPTTFASIVHGEGTIIASKIYPIISS